jgi:hypothetical protein
MGEAGFLDAPASYRRAYYDEARRITAERFGTRVHRWLPVRMRVRSELLRSGAPGAYGELFALLEAERGVRLDAALDRVRWRRGRLAVRFTARFVYGDGRPLAFPGERWEPPMPLDVSAHTLRADDRPWCLDLYLRRRTDGADHPLKIVGEHLADGVMSGEALVDEAAVPGLTDGPWDLYARVDGGGWTYERRLSGYAEDVPARGRLEPYRTVNGNLSIRVRRPPAPLDGPFRRAADRLARRLQSRRPRDVQGLPESLSP